MTTIPQQSTLSTEEDTMTFSDIEYNRCSTLDEPSKVTSCEQTAAEMLELANYWKATIETYTQHKQKSSDIDEEAEERFSVSSRNDSDVQSLDSLSEELSLILMSNEEAVDFEAQVTVAEETARDMVEETCSISSGDDGSVHSLDSLSQELSVLLMSNEEVIEFESQVKTAEETARGMEESLHQTKALLSLCLDELDESSVAVEVDQSYGLPSIGELGQDQFPELMVEEPHEASTEAIQDTPPADDTDRLLDSEEAVESKLQVAFAEQTAQEMQQLIDYWDEAERARETKTHRPKTPRRNSLMEYPPATPKSQSDAIVTSLPDSATKYVADDKDDATSTTLSLTSGGSSWTPERHNSLTCWGTLSYQDVDEPSELTRATRHVLQIESQQQRLQVDHVARTTKQLGEELKATLSTSPLYLQHCKNFWTSPRKVLETIEETVNKPLTPPLIPRALLHDRIQIWARQLFRSTLRKFDLMVWESIPKEWLTIYYYVWAQRSRRTKRAILSRLLCFLLSLYLFRTLTKLYHSPTNAPQLVHFSKLSKFHVNTVREFSSNTYPGEPLL